MVIEINHRGAVLLFVLFVLFVCLFRWEEPSQSCVPWVTHEGMSLAKWLEQWRILTAKLTRL